MESFTIQSKGGACAQLPMAIKKNIFTYKNVNLFVSVRALNVTTNAKNPFKTRTKEYVAFS